MNKKEIVHIDIRNPNSWLEKNGYTPNDGQLILQKKTTEDVTTEIRLLYLKSLVKWKDAKSTNLELDDFVNRHQLTTGSIVAGDV